MIPEFSLPDEKPTYSRRRQRKADDKRRKKQLKMMPPKSKANPFEELSFLAKTRRGRKPKSLSIRRQATKAELELQCPEMPIELGLVIKPETSKLEAVQTMQEHEDAIRQAKNKKTKRQAKEPAAPPKT
jgi:hypothetical protein